MLVVLEQSLRRGGDNPRASGDAGRELRPATLGCPRPGAGDLQMAEYAPDNGAHPGERLPTHVRRRPPGQPRGNPPGCAASVPDELRALDSAGPVTRSV